MMPRTNLRTVTGLRKLALAAAGVCVLVLLFVFLRPGDDESETDGVTQTTTQTTPTIAPPTATQPPPPPPAVPQVVRATVTVRDGKPVGGVRRMKVKKGRRVVLVVRADVSDHVHLHGYDVMRDVAPGKPARLALRATIVGRFEIELEDRRLEIARLEVRP